MSTDTQSTGERSDGRGWPARIGLALLPFVLLGVLVAAILATGGGLSHLAGPPQEKLHIDRVQLPDPGTIRVRAVNEGPNTLTISQVMVDEAFWQFEVSPSNELEPRESATVEIPYHWVEGEPHEVALVTGRGLTFHEEIPVAVETRGPSLELFGRYGLVGVYVGVLPIVLGMLWFPFLADLRERSLNFVLSLTLGLLVYLGVDTWVDALEFAHEAPEFWQGTSMVAGITALTLGALIWTGQIGERRSEASPLRLAYLIALGIGFHNLGEGLAIGAAYASGEASLGAFLILGFTLHNVTEGIGIVAPVAEDRPAIKHFALLALLAGAPAIAGTWIGGFAFDPALASAFLAAGVGAIFQVIWEVGRLVRANNEQIGDPLVSAPNLAGFAVGLALMYGTGYFMAL